MQTINHRAFRNEIRNLTGYRALSDAIKAQVDQAAPKSLETEAAKQEMLGLDALAGAYLSWVRVKREAVRTALWIEAARIITGDQTGILYANSTVYGAAITLGEDQTAVSAAKLALNPYSADDEDEEQDEDEGDDSDFAEA